MTAIPPNVSKACYIGVSKIGEGVYGSVYKTVDERAGNMVLIKKIYMNSAFENGVPATLVQEITLLKLLRHPNIISLEDAIISNSQLYLIFEFISMNLKTYISKIPNNKLMDKAKQKSYLYQILQAVSYCHQRNILHRDLKPENLLVDDKGFLKLSEFHFYEAVNTPEICYTQKAHTQYYKAPELLFGSTCYTSAVDMWSIGCIAAEMALKKALFAPGDSNIDQIFRIFSVLSTPCDETLRVLTNVPNCSETFPKWKNNHLHEILDHFMDISGIMIVQKMLTYEPEKRISAKQLLIDSYFADVDRTKLPTSE
ncbi:cell division control protein 2 homolog, putative [Brugia malayi]|uniref:Bm10150 n=1 Tax=Brugia malayi TaxID=6279 RepID=A0A0K0IM83_BRUMA|nr:cell division control protein 2 homolog, putative [Brugia malayi]CRZ24630.1 Bm10150 [Brugia malayi]VIO85896.1 cell division control protein 2 homolog, putative [Brugia malayi]